MIFILGGKGLVGSAFARYCQRTEREFAVVDRAGYAEFKGRSCDILVNANGNSSKPLAVRAPLEDFDASVRSARASLVDFRFQKYVHISSCDVYPDCSRVEKTREAGEFDPASQSPYGFHKRLTEECVRHAATDWLIFRLGGLIGPGLKKNAVFDILNGSPLYLDPRSELQFLHTDRVAEIVFELIDRGLSLDVFNLCGKGVVRLSDVVEATGHPVAVAPASPRVRYEVNIEKISAVTGIPDTRATVLDFVRQNRANGA